MRKWLSGVLFTFVLYTDLADIVSGCGRGRIFPISQIVETILQNGKMNELSKGLV